MTIPLCADEHVPNAFVTTLQSKGFDVVRARSVFGERTDDRQLLTYCADDERVLLTHDKRDFGGPVGAEIAHVGIIIYTDPGFLRDDPGAAAETVERIIDHYPRHELENDRVWLDQWRRLD